MHIEQVTEFNFLGLIIDSNLNWKAHLYAISTKIDANDGSFKDHWVSAEI